MQIAMSLGNVLDFEKVKVRNVVLTDRDFKIIDFVSEMKFASIEDIFLRFFKVTRSSVISTSMYWAEDRVQQLERAGLLKSVRNFISREKFYVGTKKGYLALVSRFPERAFLRPLETIDFREFIHDRLVTKARQHLEDSGEALSWTSDRKLRSGLEAVKDLGAAHVPDAIFTNRSGAKVALELEIALKTKARYVSKVQKYVKLMRSKDNKPFEKVQFVCAKEIVLDHLVRETKVYGDLFQIQSVDQFFNQKVNQSI